MMPIPSQCLRAARPLAAALLLALFPLPGARAQEELQWGDFTPAAECGRCHQQLYRTWRNTFHAQAAQDPVFLQELEAIDAQDGRGARVECVSCHSPTTGVTMDYSLARPLAREGVTCDFCHTVSSIDITEKGLNLSTDLSPVKAGPGRRDALPAHRTRQKPLLLQSEFCAGCHQWTNDHGVALIDTFGEWQRSLYRGEEIRCQICHMPEILKSQVMLKGKMVERPSHLHFEMGGHSQTQLATAAKLTLDSERRGPMVEATVKVENFKGGHMVPTGLPSRSVILEVSFLDDRGKILQKSERVYRRVLGDSAGRPLEDTISWVRRAAVVLEDTRLGPKERREEHFTLQPPEGVGAMIVQARLAYRQRLDGVSPPFMDYDMASARMVVGTGERKVDLTKGLAVALAILILLIVTLLLARAGLIREKDL